MLVTASVVTPFEGGLLAVDVDVKGVAGQDDAALDLDDARDPCALLLDGLGHLGGELEAGARRRRRRA